MKKPELTGEQTKRLVEGARMIIGKTSMADLAKAAGRGFRKNTQNENTKRSRS